MRERASLFRKRCGFCGRLRHYSQMFQTPFLRVNNNSAIIWACGECPEGRKLRKLEAQLDRLKEALRGRAA